MRPLEQRLQRIIEILEADDKILYGAAERAKLKQQSDAAFFMMSPDKVAEVILAATSRLPSNATSLDLGSGNGAWAIMAAAAGLTSTAIEINPYLHEHACQNYETAKKQELIPARGSCTFLVGNMYPTAHQGAYKEFAQQRNIDNTVAPQSSVDPYAPSNVSLRTANIIYSFPFEGQMPFLLHVLVKETAPNTLFALPHYVDLEKLKASLPVQPNSFGQLEEYRNIIDLASIGEQLPFFLGQRRISAK